MKNLSGAQTATLFFKDSETGELAVTSEVTLTLEEKLLGWRRTAGGEPIMEPDDRVESIQFCASPDVLDAAAAEFSMGERPPAVVLLSGGLDSATTLAIARETGFDLYAVSFRYGQRHQVELKAAKNIATRVGVVKHIILDIDLRQFGGSALTANLDVPKNRSIDEMAEGIPITYVPARNTIFLSFALAWAEVLGSTDIFIGVNALDYSGYPDCRPEFIQAFERMANLATRMGVEGSRPLVIHRPLIAMTKAQIIRKGLDLGVNYALTVTCYDPSAEGEACGVCDACLLRRKGFEENGLTDPAPYVQKTEVIA